MNALDNLSNGTALQAYENGKLGLSFGGAGECRPPAACVRARAWQRASSRLELQFQRVWVAGKIGWRRRSCGRACSLVHGCRHAAVGETLTARGTRRAPPGSRARPRQQTDTANLRPKQHHNRKTRRIPDPILCGRRPGPAAAGHIRAGQAGAAGSGHIQRRVDGRRRLQRRLGGALPRDGAEGRAGWPAAHSCELTGTAAVCGGRACSHGTARRCPFAVGRAGWAAAVAVETRPNSAAAWVAAGGGRARGCCKLPQRPRTRRCATRHAGQVAHPPEHTAAATHSSTPPAPRRALPYPPPPPPPRRFTR